MRFIVTGGSGFIGSHLIRRLLDDGHWVLNIDKMTYAANSASMRELESNPRYQIEKIDICDRALVRKCFKSFQPQMVANLAAESHVDRSISDPDAFMKTNVMGTYNLLQCARSYWEEAGDNLLVQGFKFLQVSTDEVYGSLSEKDDPFVESSPHKPSSPYSASKAGADALVQAWHRTYGLPTIVTHCSNNFGPRQYPEKLIPVAVTRALAGEPIPIYGDGRNIRDWIYVQDHVSLLMEIIQRAPAGESYNIGGECEIRNIDLIKEICAILDRLKPRADGASYVDQISFVKDRLGHDHRYAIDMSKLKELLGPVIPLSHWKYMLEKTVRWYVENPTWWEDFKAGALFHP